MQTMLNLNAYGKRAHNNLTDQLPQVNSNRKHPRGPQQPPRNGNIPIQVRSSQVHQMTNNTASVLLFARPFSDKTHEKITPGQMLFTHGGKGRMSTVLNLAQMNKYLAKKNACPHNCLETTVRREFATKDRYYFFGVMRNEANGATYRQGQRTLQRLLNTDVWGRSKISNIFGCNLHRGDVLGLALVKKYTKFHKDGVTDMSTKWQWVPTVNGKLAKYLLSPPFQFKIQDTQVSTLRSFKVGILSHAVSEKPSQHSMYRALEESDVLTSLPQVEILMV
tara:strand:- start:2191 stop:3024 length:834 start_codon:yes stop_codon:yes gene_type:complete